MPRTHTPSLGRKGRPTVAERAVPAQVLELPAPVVLEGIKPRGRGRPRNPAPRFVTRSARVMERHAELKAEGWRFKGAWLPPHALPALAALAAAHDITEAEMIRRLILAAADAAAIED